MGVWDGISHPLLPAFFLHTHRYVLDPPAMQRIQEAKVLLLGLQGLGAEVAKNLVLMGVGSLTLHDPHPTCWSDLAAQVKVQGSYQLPDQAGAEVCELGLQLDLSR